LTNTCFDNKIFNFFGKAEFTNYVTEETNSQILNKMLVAEASTISIYLLEGSLLPSTGYLLSQFKIQTFSPISFEGMTHFFPSFSPYEEDRSTLLLKVFCEMHKCELQIKTFTTSFNLMGLVVVLPPPGSPKTQNKKSMKHFLVVTPSLR
jgi:hypothetical protein